MDKSAVWAGSGCIAVFPISGSRLISPPCTFRLSIHTNIPSIGYLFCHILCKWFHRAGEGRNATLSPEGYHIMALPFSRPTGEGRPRRRGVGGKKEEMKGGRKGRGEGGIEGGRRSGRRATSQETGRGPDRAEGRQGWQHQNEASGVAAAGVGERRWSRQRQQRHIRGGREVGMEGAVRWLPMLRSRE